MAALYKRLTPVQKCSLSAGYEPSREFGWRADWQSNKYFFSLAAGFYPSYLNGIPPHPLVLFTTHTLKQRYRASRLLSQSTCTDGSWHIMGPHETRCVSLRLVRDPWVARYDWSVSLCLSTSSSHQKRELTFLCRQICFLRISRCG